MKTLAIALVLLVASTVNAFDPPRGLRWGMTYDEVKTTLTSKPKDKRLKVDKLKSHDKLPESFRRAKLKGVKLLDRKAREAWAIFDPDGGLCAVQQGFGWDNDEHTTNMFETKGKGRAQCWEYNRKLVQALTTKYGPPISDESKGTFGEPIASGVKLETRWADTTSGTSVTAVISRRTKNAVIVRLDIYMTLLVYSGPTYIDAKEVQVVENEDL